MHPHNLSSVDAFEEKSSLANQLGKVPQAISLCGWFISHSMHLICHTYHVFLVHDH